MKHILLIIIFATIFIGNGLIHYHNMVELKAAQKSLKLQAEIEVKRTALMVVYQQILQNVAKEVDDLKQEKETSETRKLSKFLNQNLNDSTKIN